MARVREREFIPAPCLCPITAPIIHTSPGQRRDSTQVGVTHGDKRVSSEWCVLPARPAEVLVQTPSLEEFAEEVPCSPAWYFLYHSDGTTGSQGSKSQWLLFFKSVIRSGGGGWEMPASCPFSSSSHNTQSLDLFFQSLSSRSRNTSYGHRRASARDSSPRLSARSLILFPVKDLRMFS